MIVLPELRAPFIAPGRRNRKVHWNRPLTRAINSLGKFEREDWRRASWLPESLRGFYPKWNNQFAPGCCCSTTPDNSCTDRIDCLDDSWASASMPTTAEIEMPTMTDLNCSGAGHDGSCADYSGTFILNEISAGLYRYTASYLIHPTICASALDTVTIELQITCASNCTHEGRFTLVSDQGGAGGYSHNASYSPSGVVKGTALPWSFSFVSDGQVFGYTDGPICNLSGDFLVTGFA